MNASLENEDRLRLRTLLSAFEAELRELARLAEVAQTTLSGALSYVAEDPACHRDAQVLDVLTQRLYGMSGFLATLTPSVPRIWQVNTSAAMETLCLGHLVDRLNGMPVAEVQVQDVGELELF